MVIFTTRFISALWLWNETDAVTALKSTVAIGIFDTSVFSVVTDMALFHTLVAATLMGICEAVMAVIEWLFNIFLLCWVPSTDCLLMTVLATVANSIHMQWQMYLRYNWRNVIHKSCMIECRTCWGGESNYGCCLSCAFNCHKGHILVYRPAEEIKDLEFCNLWYSSPFHIRSILTL